MEEGFGELKAQVFQAKAISRLCNDRAFETITPARCFIARPCVFARSFHCFDGVTQRIVGRLVAGHSHDCGQRGCGCDVVWCKFSNH